MVESNADTLLKSKATQQSNETEANPYNSKKDYIDYCYWDVEVLRCRTMDPFIQCRKMPMMKIRSFILYVCFFQHWIRSESKFCTIREKPLSSLVKMCVRISYSDKLLLSGRASLVNLKWWSQSDERKKVSIFFIWLLSSTSDLVAVKVEFLLSLLLLPASSDPVKFLIFENEVLLFSCLFTALSQD